jgi:hypothetical protein
MNSLLLLLKDLLLAIAAYLPVLSLVEQYLGLHAFADC